MPYRKTGFVIVPRTVYLPQFAKEIQDSFGAQFDTAIAECIKSLGRENIFLKTFFFERLLTIKHPLLDGNSDLRMKFIIVLADLLKSVGFIDQCPVLIDYVVDPTYDCETLIDLVLGTRLPAWTASDLNGEFATIDTLMMFFAEVIRRYALLLNERPELINRFRRWIGSLGYKIMVNDGQLSQAERSFFTVFCSTKPNTKGWMRSQRSAAIAPVECKDPLVLEIAGIASALCLPGPSTNHYKLISNAILEQLVFYYGPHVPALKTSVGFGVEYGDFTEYKMTPADELPWTLESQIYGIMATVQNFMVKIGDLPPFALHPPLPFVPVKTNNAMAAAYPDDPGFRLWLTDDKDCSSYTWDYPSTWRARRINSATDGGTMDYAIADAAVIKKTAGGMQTEATDLSSFGLCWLTPTAQTKITKHARGITESIILPGPQGPNYIDVDMTAFYARFGDVMMLPAFSEYMSMPMDWFMTPNDKVVDYVASIMALTLEVRARYSRAIAISHNCAIYTRVTQQPPPIDALSLVRSLMGRTLTNSKPTT